MQRQGADSAAQDALEGESEQTSSQASPGQGAPVGEKGANLNSYPPAAEEGCASLVKGTQWGHQYHLLHFHPWTQVVILFE